MEHVRPGPGWVSAQVVEAAHHRVRAHAAAPWTYAAQAASSSRSTLSVLQLTHKGPHTCDIIAARRAPVALCVRHGQAGRDKPLHRKACCLGMYKRGWRVGIKDMRAQRLQGSGIDRGRGYAIEGLGEPVDGSALACTTSRGNGTPP
jgi:hypothetical protein